MIHQVATESECERDLFNDDVIQCIDVPELIPNEMSDGREVERGEENNTRALTVRQSLPEVSLQFSDTISCATPSNPKRAIPAWARLQLREAHFGHVFHDSIYHALRLNQRLQRLLRSTVQIVDVWLVGINASRRDLEADFRDEHRARKQLCITSAEEPFHLNVRDSIEFNLTCEKGRQIEAIYTPPVPRNYFRTTQSCKTGSESTDPTTRLACHVLVPNHDAFLSPWNLFRLLVPYNFRKVNSWSAADDRLLRQGVHYFLQRLRLRSRQRKSLKEFAGMGVMGMTDLLDHSSGVQASWRDAESINWRDLVWKCRNGPCPIAQVIFKYYLKVSFSVAFPAISQHFVLFDLSGRLRYICRAVSKMTAACGGQIAVTPALNKLHLQMKKIKSSKNWCRKEVIPIGLQLQTPCQRLNEDRKKKTSSCARLPNALDGTKHT